MDERVKVVKTMLSNNLGIDIDDEYALLLADKTQECTIGVIESTIKTVGARGDLKSKEEKLEALNREVDRTRPCFMLYGETPEPYATSVGAPEGFDLRLVKSNETLEMLIPSFITAAKDNPSRLQGLDMALVGPAGSGRKSIARHFMGEVGLRTHEVSFNPQSSHAEDIEEAERDGKALLIKDAEKC